MKRKHLFASVAMAAVLAGCSQEELTGLSNNNLQNLGDRPMVEAPVLTVGGVDSRMTAEDVSANGFANVEWAAGDGFGAAVMDIYHSGKDKWDDKFEIVDYINSNVLFKTEDGKNFYAEASMPQGNHLFYAPFNVNNISREPLATQLPINQVVVASTNGMPSNSAIAAFYEDNTSPVFVAYDVVEDTPKTQLALEMRHIYSLPLVTLELGDVQLLDEDGNLKVDEDGEKVYESNITIDAIKFVQNENDKNIVTRGWIKNSSIKSLLKNQGDGTVAWDAKKFEDAATSDIVMTATESKTVDAYETITVTFEGGLKLTKANKGQFFMVLPGADYTQKALAVYVYATIDGKSYISALKSDDKDAATIQPKRSARLLPGLPYAADEYNADGTKKTTAGSSMTYTIEGGFIPSFDVETTGYVDIKTYGDLEAYVKEMAYRGETLVQLSKEDAIKMIEKKGIGNGAGQYDPKKYFVITAEEKDAIELDDTFISTFENACVVTGKNAKIAFCENQKNLVLGDIEWTKKASKFFTFGGKVWAKGNVTLKDAPATQMSLLSSANVTLDAAMTSVITVANKVGGTVNLESKLGHTITNEYGTLYVNASTAAEISNGKAKKTEDETDECVMYIADEVMTTGDIINRKTGVAEIGDAVVAMKNNGTVTMKEKSGKLTVTSGTGKVNNTVAAKVTNTTNTVYAEVSTLYLEGKYDKLSGLNTLNITGVISEIAHDFNDLTIKTINFEENSGINFAGILDVKTVDLAGVETININANVTWRGRDVEATTIKVKSGAIKESKDCKLTLDDINVEGYQEYVAGEVGLTTALDNGSEVITLTGDATLTENLVLSQNVTIKGGNIVGNGAVNVQDGASVVFEGVTFDNEVTAAEALVNVAAGDVTMKDCVIGGTAGRPIIVSVAAKDVTLDGCLIEHNEGQSNIYINPTSGTVTIKNCTFENESLVCEVYGNESKFVVTGNTFGKSFTFTTEGVAEGDLTDECKAFCNEVLENNTFLKTNKIAVTNNLQNASNENATWYYINEAFE